MESNKAQISFVLLPQGQIVSASHGSTVLAACLEARIDLDHSCGGMGTCGTCRVFVEGVSLSESPRTELEFEIADDRHFAENERLACQLLVKPGLRVLRPKA